MKILCLAVSRSVRVLHLSRGEAGHGPLLREGLDLRAQGGDLLGLLEHGQEVHKLLADLGLDVEADLHALLVQLRDRLHVRLNHATRRHGARADADAARVQRRRVRRHRVLVHGDRDQLERALHLGARQAQRLQVPHEQVVVRAARHQVPAPLQEALAHRRHVLAHLRRVRLELRRHHLEHLRADGRDLVLVRAALQTREDRHVDLLLPARRGAVLPRLRAEEDHTRARAAQRLVRRRRHHVRELERRLGLLRRHQTADVRHVHHQDGADLVRDAAELRVRPLTRVRRASVHQDLRAEHLGVALQLLHVQVAVRLHLVRERLEVDRRRRDLLLRRVVAVRQVATAREVQAHDAVVRLEERRVHAEVGRRARVRLHVHAPLAVVRLEHLQATLLRQLLDLVDELVAAVVPVADLALRVLVRQARAHALHHGPRRQVLRRNHLEAGPLAVLLLLDPVGHDGVMLREGEQLLGGVRHLGLLRNANEVQIL
eukprot:Rhum_TRINITY_DN14962_c0_g1::Rhum_TRINITY_DN14962_c0_g1_i1::g.130528::m.130528